MCMWMELKLRVYKCTLLTQIFFFLRYVCRVVVDRTHDIVAQYAHISAVCMNVCFRHRRRHLIIASPPPSFGAKCWQSTERWNLCWGGKIECTAHSVVCWVRDDCSPSSDCCWCRSNATAVFGNLKHSLSNYKATDSQAINLRISRFAVFTLHSAMLNHPNIIIAWKQRVLIGGRDTMVGDLKNIIGTS